MGLLSIINLFIKHLHFSEKFFLTNPLTCDIIMIGDKYPKIKTKEDVKNESSLQNFGQWLQGSHKVR